MRHLVAVIPLLLWALLLTLHVLSVAKPSPEPLGLLYSLIFVPVFSTPFFISGTLSRNGIKISAISIYAAHLHVPQRLSVLAYGMLAVSLGLFAFASAHGAEFDRRSGLTAFWMAVVSCPAVLWWHFQLASSKGVNRSSLPQ
jgi:hypothetical protein